PQHRHEDVDGVGGNAHRVPQNRAFRGANRRVVGAIHLRAAVDEIQERLGGHQGGEIFTISLRCMRIGAALALLAALTISGARCRGSEFFRQYEYEEDVYLSLDGSATVYVNASVAALDALRGAAFDTSSNASIDRDAVRAWFTTPATKVTRTPTLSRRSGRRF